MIKKVRTLFQSALTKMARVRAFSQTKRQIVEALDFRLVMLNKNLEVFRKNPTKSNWSIEDTQSRIDELETFRHYVKGMLIKVEE